MRVSRDAEGQGRTSLGQHVIVVGRLEFWCRHDGGDPDLQYKGYTIDSFGAVGLVTGE